jgi:hypothetical protein
MMDIETSSQSADDLYQPFSPKRIIMLFQDLIQYLLSKWLPIMLLALAFGIAGAIYSYLKDPTYTAEISFGLEEESPTATGGGISNRNGLSGFISALDNNEPFFSTTGNITELIKSRLLIEKTLLSKVVVGDQQILLADFFLDSLKFRRKWVTKNGIEGLDFSSDSISAFKMLQRNAILGSMYERLTTRFLKVEKKSPTSSILVVSCITEHELFSKLFLESLIQNVTQYYVETKTQRAKLNLVFLQRRVDSTRTAYLNASYGSAQFADANLNPGRQVGLVPGDRRQTDAQVLKETYVDLSRNLESARTLLLRNTPLFQYLDQPVLPLAINKLDMVKYFVLVALLGIFLGGIFFTVRYFFHSIMNN